MKIGMKEYLGVADRMALLVLELRVRSNVIAHEARRNQNVLIRIIWWLEVNDCNENRHEGRHRED